MKKRQDMFSNQILGLIWPSEDQVFVEIGIESEQPVEAIIMKTINAKQTLNDMAHLKKFVKKISHEQFSPLDKAGLSVFAEGEENAKNVFSSQLVEFLAKNADSIHVLHITDQKCYSPYAYVIKLGLNLKETKESHEQAAKVLSSLVSQFIDQFAT